MAHNNHELVVCIVNAGFSQNVMEAARGAGAKGGTILRARGSANPEAEEFFHITVQPDKEVVLILAPEAIKDALMKAVYKEAGLGAQANGIIFSLPASRITDIKE